MLMPSTRELLAAILIEEKRHSEQFDEIIAFFKAWMKQDEYYHMTTLEQRKT